jgi:hypothetical protein
VSDLPYRLLSGTPHESGQNVHSSGEYGKERWTLLCICSEQISFQKDDIKRYATRKAALDLGYAIEGGSVETIKRGSVETTEQHSRCICGRSWAEHSGVLSDQRIS